MAVLRPFRALRPIPALAAEVAAPPYDVVDAAEAAALAAGRPRSFLHVTRPEIDLPAGCDPHADDAHRQARRALDGLVADRVLVRDERPAYTVYAAPAADGGTGVQVGVVGVVSAAEYRAGVVRTHEHTRPDKLDDRRRHIEAVCAHDEPVLLLAPPDAEVDRVLGEVTADPPDVAVTGAVDGGAFSVWVVDDPDRVKALEAAFAAMAALYVADGHHRSEAAALVWEADGRPPGATRAVFPALVIPADRACVLPYDRLVHDLGGRTVEALLAGLAADFDVVPAQAPLRPARRGRLGLYAPGAGASGALGAAPGAGWYLLTARPGVVDASDPVARLDVSLLQDRVLGPLLGIHDPRTDPRIGFVGGRAPADLAALVDSGRAACAFTLHATSPDDVMAVARSGDVMPPKSTWFAPKPYSGLFVHPL
ncbi:MAG: DUF1015 domain-containing protein [Kineosporiaceae bacterium]